MSFFIFFFLFLSSPIYIHICIGPTKTLPKEGPVFHFHPLLSYENIFMIYISRIPELEDTSAKKRSECEIVITGFESFDKSVLGNPKKYTYSLYVRDILSEIAPNSTYWITQLKISLHFQDTDVTRSWLKFAGHIHWRGAIATHF